MPGGIPQSPFDVRESIRRESCLGYRAVQVLGFVYAYHAKHGRTPSYGTIRDELGFADKADVCKVIGRLEKRELLQRARAGIQRGAEWRQPVLRLPC